MAAGSAIAVSEAVSGCVLWHLAKWTEHHRHPFVGHFREGEARRRLPRYRPRPRVDQHHGESRQAPVQTQLTQSQVVEYFVYNLLTNSGTAEVQGFLNKYDFIFFPIVNPDGFVYTQTNDRLWRKNRQSTSGSTCIGHDINRNWAYKWDVSGGASTNPCAQDFKGLSQSDAPETTALAAWLRATKASQGVKLFIDWHAYSQLFMTRKFPFLTS